MKLPKKERRFGKTTDRRANETLMYIQKLCSPTMYKNCVPVCIENCVLHQCLVRMPLTLVPRMCAVMIPCTTAPWYQAGPGVGDDHVRTIIAESAFPVAGR